MKQNSNENRNEELDTGTEYVKETNDDDINDALNFDENVTIEGNADNVTLPKENRCNEILSKSIENGKKYMNLEYELDKMEKGGDKTNTDENDASTNILMSASQAKQSELRLGEIGNKYDESPKMIKVQEKIEEIEPYQPAPLAVSENIPMPASEAKQSELRVGEIRKNNSNSPKMIKVKGKIEEIEPYQPAPMASFDSNNNMTEENLGSEELESYPPSSTRPIINNRVTDESEIILEEMQPHPPSIPTNLSEPQRNSHIINAGNISQSNVMITDAYVVPTESERRHRSLNEQIRQIVANAPLIDDVAIAATEPPAASVVVPQKTTNLFHGSRSIRILCGMILICLVVVTIVVVTTKPDDKHKPDNGSSINGPMIATTTDGPGMTPTTAPPSTTTRGSLTSILHDSSVTNLELMSNDETSPQYRSFEWLLTDVSSSFYDGGDDWRRSWGTNETRRVIQRYVLAVLYFSTGGEGWISSAGFLSSDHECDWNDEWDGGEAKVVCYYGDGVVTDISMKSNNLTGTIPDELGKIGSLEWLSLYNNGIEGRIPDAIGDLQNLTLLEISANTRMKGPIPSSFAKLRNIRDLSLSKNGLTGTISSFLCQLQSLVVVMVMYNPDLTGSIPLCIGNLTMLHRMDLIYNNLVGTIPPEIGGLTNLRELHLFHNRLTGHIPSSVKHLSALQSITLRNNNLSGTIPPSLFRLQTLQRIGLEMNYLTGNIPDDIHNLDGIEYFGVEINFLSGTIPTSLSHCSNMLGLGLSGNALSGTIPIDIGNARNLNFLRVYDNRLTGTIPDSIKAMTSLDQLHVNTNKFVGNINFLCDGSNSYVVSHIVADCLGDDPMITCDCCWVCCDGKGYCGIKP